MNFLMRDVFLVMFVNSSGRMFFICVFNTSMSLNVVVFFFCVVFVSEYDFGVMYVCNLN